MVRHRRCHCGLFLGMVVIIPLRKQMIEFERLRFPSGIAVASLLKSPARVRDKPSCCSVALPSAVPSIC